MALLQQGFGIIFFPLQNANGLKIHRPCLSECRGILGNENGDGPFHGSPKYSLCPETKETHLETSTRKAPSSALSLLSQRQSLSRQRIRQQ